jgi:hypothetical protein
VTAPDRPDDPRIRRGLLALAGASCAGIAVELVLARHWTEPTQLVAWVALALLASSAAMVARAPDGGAPAAVRAAAGLVFVASLLGVVLHVHGNYEAGPLDAAYGPDWDSMSGAARWWAALIQRVGPAPTIVPLLLSQVALMVRLAAGPRPTRRRPTRATP